MRDNILKAIHTIINIRYCTDKLTKKQKRILIDAEILLEDLAELAE